ncbi:unnamed protein product, partial [Scytosiphon promiscuus]
KSGGGNKSGGGSKKAKTKKRNTAGKVIEGWQPIDDSEVCNVCMDGQDYDRNPLMSCSRCKVLVHQHCYACREEPEEGTPWLCDVCEDGGNAAHTPCELCKETGHKGGAMKQVLELEEGKKEKLWVHVSCSLWIPEVRFITEDLTPVQLHSIEASRKTLKCLLCGLRGVCVQCAGGRCLHSYHPWCLIHSERGIIIRSITKQSHLHVYCQDHKRCMMHSSLDLEGRTCLTGPMNYTEAASRILPKMQRGFLPVSTPSSGGKGGARSGSGSRLGGSKQANSSKKRNRDGIIDMDVAGSAFSHPHSPHMQQGRKRRRKFGPGPSGPSAKDVVGEGDPDSVDKEGALMEMKDDPDLDEEGNLVLHTVWDKAGAPRMGQENLTSERFWEIMGSYFAEGHKEGWLDRLLDIEHLPKSDDPAYTIPEPDVDNQEQKQSDKEGGGKGEGEDGSKKKRSGSSGGGSKTGGGDDGAESDDSNPISVDDESVDAAALEDDDDDLLGTNYHRRGRGGSSSSAGGGGSASKGGR